jgi:hypothetical protein
MARSLAIQIHETIGLLGLPAQPMLGEVEPAMGSLWPSKHPACSSGEIGSAWPISWAFAGSL